MSDGISAGGAVTGKELSLLRGVGQPEKGGHPIQCPHGTKNSYNCRKCDHEYRLDCTAKGIPVNEKKTAFCVHGRQKSKCKECKGSSICIHERQKSMCKDCGGSGICSHGRQWSRCKECGGSSICSHGRQKRLCSECGGSSKCSHGRQKSQCKECGGGSICSHDRVRSKCKECGGSSICSHGRQKSQCKDCGGSSICSHGRVRDKCKDCGGSSICSHGKRKDYCVECADPSKRCPCGRKFLGKCLECADPSLKCSCGKFFSRCKQCRELRQTVLELRSSQGAPKPDEPARSGDVESLICTGCRETKQPASFFDAITGTFVNVCDICRMGKGGQGRGQEDEEEDNDESLLEDGDPRPFGDLDRTIKCFQCEEYLPIDHFPENVDEDNFPTCTSCLEEIDHTPVQPCTGGCGKYIKPSRSGEPAICDGCKDL